MKMFKSLVFLLSIISSGILAADEVKLGISGQVSVDGFFSPTVTSFIVKKVEPNSPAEKAGIAVGQKIISIDNCKIPGCPADEAKKLMRKQSGEILQLVLENEDGSQIPVEVTMNAW
ncbi:MAG: PDZ domain-containing protein [Colwellia sp.]|nr:PDZ domain-containing protein [Colwellia sp.]